MRCLLCRTSIEEPCVSQTQCGPELRCRCKFGHPQASDATLRARPNGNDRNNLAPTELQNIVLVLQYSQFSFYLVMHLFAEHIGSPFATQLRQSAYNYLLSSDKKISFDFSTYFPHFLGAFLLSFWFLIHSSIVHLWGRLTCNYSWPFTTACLWSGNYKIMTQSQVTRCID